MVDHLPLVVALPVAATACITWAVMARRDHIAQRRARHQS